MKFAPRATPYELANASERKHNDNVEIGNKPEQRIKNEENIR